MKRRLPVFYIVLIAASTVFLTALAIFLCFLYSYLDEYESTRPYNVVEKAIARYFLTEDKNALIDDSDFTIPEFTTKEYIIDYLNNIISEDNITYNSETAVNASELTYAVIADNLKIANIKLTECLDKSKHGFSQYMVSDIKLTIGADSAVNIKASSDAAVFVNGRLVGSEFIDGEPERTSSCEHMYDGVNGITYITYKIDGLFGNSDITARSKDGYSLDVINVDEDNIFYEIPVVYSEPTPELEALVFDASEAYAAYMQRDSTFYNIAKYVDSTSDLYYDLKTSDTRWVNEHTGYYIEDKVLSELYYYDENTFSCRVSFTHVLYGGWGGDYKNDFDMTFYFRLNGNNWLIYDSQVN